MSITMERDSARLLAIRYLVIHCAATPADMDIGREEIDRWHRQRGFREIGYHKVIRRDGRQEDGRSMSVAGAHALGFNTCSYGVCLAGGVKSLPHGEPEANFTAAQMQTLRVLLEEWSQRWPGALIVGHRDLPSPASRLKACPSFDVARWLAEGRPARPVA